jgi:hypothetical protein
MTNSEGSVNKDYMLKIWDIYNVKYRSLQKDYAIILGLSFIFIVFFLYPYLATNYTLLAFSDIKKNSITWIGSLSAINEIQSVLNSPDNINNKNINNTSTLIQRSLYSLINEVTTIKEKLKNMLFFNQFNRVNEQIINNITSINNNLLSTLESTVSMVNKNHNNFSEYESSIRKSVNDTNFFISFLSNNSKTISTIENVINKTKQEDIENFKKLETPFGFGKNFLRFEYFVLFAPLGIVIGFIYCTIKYIDLINFNKFMHKEISQNSVLEIAWEGTWPRPVYSLYSYLFWIIPSSFYILSVVFNINLLLNSSFNETIVIYPLFPLFLYILGILIFLYFIRKIHKALDKRKLKLPKLDSDWVILCFIITMISSISLFFMLFDVSSPNKSVLFMWNIFIFIPTIIVLLFLLIKKIG